MRTTCAIGGCERLGGYATIVGPRRRLGGTIGLSRGKKGRHGNTYGTTTRGDHGGGADDLRASVDGDVITEGGGGLPGH
jgi:hypothetical protein